MKELHFLAFKARQMITFSLANDAILNLSVHGHCHVTYAVFLRERSTTVTAYRGFATKSQLLETLFTRN